MTCRKRAVSEVSPVMLQFRAGGQDEQQDDNQSEERGTGGEEWAGKGEDRGEDRWGGEGGVEVGCGEHVRLPPPGHDLGYLVPPVQVRSGLWVDKHMEITVVWSRF